MPFKEGPPIPAPEVDFRWLTNLRSEEHCGPFQLGRSLGFVVPSPIDVAIDALDEIQFRGTPTDAGKFAIDNGIVEVWQRDGGYIGFKKHTFLKRYEFRVDDHWECMFIPNGKNTIEWRLGFDANVTGNFGLLVAPPPDPVPNIEIPYGYLSASALQRMTNGSGFSIAIKPLESTHIARGTPLARLIPLPSELFKITLEIS